LLATGYWLLASGRSLLRESSGFKNKNSNNQQCNTVKASRQLPIASR